ncbi:hypothetical protein BGZ61DRAFT_523078 [Ilyonectria robusta]|uniref:uncharacterized protein n=1 Tax=Ilyonectria robusta TaxID=1079257 RepID=UPI001E8DDB7E|nr:uncharacterized protein BGZ61DRAFT_523078 [Ilyonectria robusta]KAH8662750.1 hypothetical protein BGZ61DRAFT_523078 [Ilyonectria robusta]
MHAFDLLLPPFIYLSLVTDSLRVLDLKLSGDLPVNATGRRDNEKSEERICSRLRDVSFHKEEEISMRCLGRSSKASKNFLNECRDEYLRLIKNKTAVFKHRNDRWERATAVDTRPLSTVILGDAQKQSFIKDVEDFLNPRTRRWYSWRSMPYRRGYLLYGSLSHISPARLQQLPAVAGVL